jgi:hypothetical protein
MHILTAQQMAQQYKAFYDQSPKLKLDQRNVPEKFWPLLPYAEFWGITDDVIRDKLVEQAPPIAKENLKFVVQQFDDALDEWLAGPEADGAEVTEEYVAYSAMRMMAYNF